MSNIILKEEQQRSECVYVFTLASCDGKSNTVLESVSDENEIEHLEPNMLILENELRIGLVQRDNDQNPIFFFFFFEMVQMIF